MILKKLNYFFAIIVVAILAWPRVHGQKSAPKIDQHPNSIIVNVSDPVTLECRASGEPKPKITWFKDGQQLEITELSPAAAAASSSGNKYALIHDSNLFIFSASLGKGNKSDNGVYQCRADNEHGSAVSTNATLTITYIKDDFRETPKNRQVNSGTNIYMDCKAPRGLPEPKVYWEKNGIPITLTEPSQHKQQQQEYKLFPNGTLAIYNSSLFDNGEYVCIAKNHAGIKKSVGAHLSVFEKPRFTLEPKNTAGQANTKAELKCEASGFPKPQIEWKKDGLAENLPNKVLVRNNMLIIPNLKPDDEGEYTCVATNQLASVESRAFVSVYDRPSFVKPMPNLTIGVENKPLTIECNARGKPTPTIYWARSSSVTKRDNNDEEASDNEDFIILENGDLYIERVSKKYEGTYLCQARNEHGQSEAKTYLKVKPVHFNLPPIIMFGPQNQTIPVNTKAILECMSYDHESNGAGGGEYEDNNRDSSVSVKWYKDNRLVVVDELGKHRLLDSGTLQINSVQNGDTGVYKCVASNRYGETTSMEAYLLVENPNNPNVEFKRNQEISALPSAPTQPQIGKVTARSVTISWQFRSHTGHSPLVSYSIEYFSPEWSRNLPGWELLAENLSPLTNSFTVDNLLPDTYYTFIIRARNGHGFGSPSQRSDFVKTSPEREVSSFKRPSYEFIEKELIGEVIQLNENAQVLSSTAINITWKLFKPSNLIEGFYVKYKPVGTAGDYQVQTVPNAHHRRQFYVLDGLKKFTTYEILVEPFSGQIRATESNVIQAKTREDVPSHSPTSLQIHMDSLTSILIKWQPPPYEHMNGIILGYKINCLTNETKFNLNLNTNASTRAIILGNLIENMSYCVKVAAYTRPGIGPFTRLECIEMTHFNLLKAHNRQVKKSSESMNNIRGLFSKSWFIGIILLVSFLVFVIIFALFHYLNKSQLIKNAKNSKYILTNDNYSLNTRDTNHNHVHGHNLATANLIVNNNSLNNNNNNNNNGGSATGGNKLNNSSNHYKLVNDTIWLDTLNSFSNQSNQEFILSDADLKNQIYFKQKPYNEMDAANVKLISEYLNHHHNHHQNHLSSSSSTDRRHNNNNNNNHNNSYLSSTTKTNNAPESGQHCMLKRSNSTSSVSSSGPQYAEIYGTSTSKTNNHNHHNANPYATTGLFVNDSNNKCDQAAYDYENNKLANCLYSTDAIKTLNNNILLSYTAAAAAAAAAATAKPSHMSMLNSMDESQKIAKYLLSQSQTNTPKVAMKNLHNKVKSVETQVMPANMTQTCAPNYLYELLKLNNANDTGPQLHNYLHNRVLFNGEFKNIHLNSNHTTSRPCNGCCATESATNNGKSDKNTSSRIRTIYDSFMNSNNSTNKTNNLFTANKTTTNGPSLPAAPPPSLTSALLVKQIEQQLELQNHHLTQLQLHQAVDVDAKYNNAHSPVQYSSPWNSNGLETNAAKKLNINLVNQLINQQQPSTSNSNSLVSNLTGNSTLSRGGYMCNLNNQTGNSTNQTTFTSQQYVNRNLSASRQPVEFQEYSLITDECENHNVKTTAIEASQVRTTSSDSECNDDDDDDSSDDSDLKIPLESTSFISSSSNSNNNNNNNNNNLQKSAPSCQPSPALLKTNTNNEKLFNTQLV